MKKILSFCLAIVMLIAILPTRAFAAESSLSSREDLITSACNLFPEYADKIQGVASSAAYGQKQISDQKNLVTEETRSLSENEQITYNEYSDGTVYVVGANIHPWYDTDSSTSSGSSTTFYTGHIIITSNVNDDAVLIISKIKYAYVSGADDYVLSAGTATSQFSSELIKSTITRTQQSNGTPAEISYRLTFSSADGTEIEPFTLYFQVMNESYATKWVYG